MPVFSLSSILEFGAGIQSSKAVAPGITTPICMSVVVTNTDPMFRKIFELLWFEKFHVEMDLVCSEGSYDDFYLYLNKC